MVHLESQYLNVLSQLAVANISPPGVFTNLTHLIGISCAATCVACLASRSYTFAVLSALPLATYFPEEWKCVESTGPVCSYISMPRAPAEPIS